MHSAHALAPEVWYRFLAVADAFLETILPYLLRIRLSLVMPLSVFSLVPRNTCDLANLPRAILLTRLAFMLLAPFIAETFIGRTMTAETTWEEVMSELRLHNC